MSLTHFTFRGIELPAELQESIDAFVHDGRPMGSFLTACADNDLREAVKRADENNLQRIPAIVAYFFNETPLNCWGYRGSAQAWISKKQKERTERQNGN